MSDETVGPGVLADAVNDLASTLEFHEQRLSTVESGSTTTSRNDGQSDDGGNADRRVRTRGRRRPGRRRTRVAGHDRPSPAATLDDWVNWLRNQGLHDEIPADWRQIPLVVSELDALHTAWLACCRSRHASFEWVHWHDALGRTIARIEQWHSTHQRKQGLAYG